MTDNPRCNLSISIETNANGLARDLMGGPSLLKVNDTFDIPGNATLTFKKHVMKLGLDIPQTLEFVLNFGTGVAGSLVASWIYSKLSGKATKITINRTVVELSEGEIRRIIQETIKSS